MLLVPDLPAAVADLVAGDLPCPTDRCEDPLRPWGWARPRRVRVAIDRVVTRGPCRGYCLVCRHSHVLSDLATYPRPLDTASTVTSALAAAVGGLGHRRVAELVDRPASTVREWLRRARRNAGVVRADALVAFHHLERDPGRVEPQGSPLADMVHVVGLATAAWARRHGAVLAPPQLATLVTLAGILGPSPQPRWLGLY